MNKTLLLFIHGLGGHPQKTWGKFPQLIEQDSDLADKVDCRFYSFPTKLWSVPFLSSSPKIQTLADGLASDIKHRYSDYQRVVLIAHSLGGLVARQHLLDITLAQQSHSMTGLLLYAVPNNGAGLASVAKYLSWWQPQLKQLCNESDFISTLNKQWVQLKLGELIPAKFIVGGTDAVVSKSSAESYWGNEAVETVVDKGHIDLVKPDNSDDLAFLILKHFVIARLENPEGRGSTNETPATQKALKTDSVAPNNLPHANLYFSGRTSQLAKLHQSLQDKNLAAVTQPVALHGLGGVGKSQLAIQYAWAYQSHYSAVLWIEAGTTEEAWDLGLEGLASILGIPLAQSDVRLQAVIKWLQEHDDWLVIVDNVDSESLQRRILKDSEQFHRGCWLFTSRLSQWSPQVAHIDLDTFSPEEALEFLAARLEFEINAQEAGDLSEQLGYLPLALEQAAAYMQARGQDLATYRRLLTEQPETLLQAAPKNYPRAVWKTWSLTYHGLGDDAQRLMQLLCSFAPEPLPRELIMDQVETIADSLWNNVDKA